MTNALDRINLSTDEARTLWRDGRVVIFREILNLDVPRDADEVFVWFAPKIPGTHQEGLWARRNATDGSGWIRFLRESPYTPGQRYWVAEPWAKMDRDISCGDVLCESVQAEQRDGVWGWRVQLRREDRTHISNQTSGI